MAAESPFKGERDNALAAATRLAAKCGMSLQEAAASAPEPRVAEPPRRPARADPDLGKIILMDQQILADKFRRAAALRAARARGLDAESSEQAQPGRTARRYHSHSRMNPFLHARMLIRETSLPLREIASITGLDIYQVVGMKLKMRAAA
ncbi:MAG: hypothetical protein ACE5Q3_08860 [Alphaproteobacteria bacterium]